MADTPKPHPGKIRHCWICGADMGFVANRHYDRRDTCGALECDRETRDAYEAERQEAHDAVDNDFNNRW